MRFSQRNFHREAKNAHPESPLGVNPFKKLLLGALVVGSLAAPGCTTPSLEDTRAHTRATTLTPTRISQWDSLVAPLKSDAGEKTPYPEWRTNWTLWITRLQEVNKNAKNARTGEGLSNSTANRLVAEVTAKLVHSMLMSSRSYLETGEPSQFRNILSGRPQELDMAVEELGNSVAILRGTPYEGAAVINARVAKTLKDDSVRQPVSLTRALEDLAFAVSTENGLKSSPLGVRTVAFESAENAVAGFLRIVKESKTLPDGSHLLGPRFVKGDPENLAVASLGKSGHEQEAKLLADENNSLHRAFTVIGRGGPLDPFNSSVPPDGPKLRRQDNAL